MLFANLLFLWVFFFFGGGERWYYDDEKWYEQFFNGEHWCDEKRIWWMIRWCDDMMVKMMDAWSGDDEWWDDGAMCPHEPPQDPHTTVGHAILIMIVNLFFLSQNIFRNKHFNMSAKAKCTRSPIIMEVANYLKWKETKIGDIPIFHFSDYGRKGKR